MALGHFNCGSMLSIGSAAGVALMRQAQGNYTFFGHLKWTPVIALGYFSSIVVTACKQRDYRLRLSANKTLKQNPMAECRGLTSSVWPAMGVRIFYKNAKDG